MKAPALFALAFATALLGGCGSSGSSGGPAGSSNGGGNGNSSLATYSLFKNGAYGTWFGMPLIVEAGANAGFAANTDTITGDPTTLAVSTVGANDTPWVQFRTCASGAPSCAQKAGTNGYVSGGGKIQFDILLGMPLAQVNSVTVYFGDRTCMLSQQPNATLSNATWTHVSLPLSSFVSGCGVPGSSEVAFQVSLQRKVAGSLTGFYVNDVKWTP